MTKLKKESSPVVIYSREHEPMLEHLYDMAIKKGGIDKLDRYELTAIVKCFCGKLLDSTKTDDDFEIMSDRIFTALGSGNSFVMLTKAAVNTERDLLIALNVLNDMYKQRVR